MFNSDTKDRSVCLASPPVPAASVHMDPHGSTRFTWDRTIHMGPHSSHGSTRVHTGLHGSTQSTWVQTGPHSSHRSTQVPQQFSLTNVEFRYVLLPFFFFKVRGSTLEISAVPEHLLFCFPLL